MPLPFFHPPKMTYICINDDISLTHPDKTGKTRVTNGKVYNGEECYVGIRVTNDDGEKEAFVEERFVMLRDINLERILG